MNDYRDKAIDNIERIKPLMRDMQHLFYVNKEEEKLTMLTRSMVILDELIILLAKDIYEKCKEEESK